MIKTDFKSFKSSTAIKLIVLEALTDIWILEKSFKTWRNATYCHDYISANSPLNGRGELSMVNLAIPLPVYKTTVLLGFSPFH